ncbi:ER membrane protein complex subunit 10 [Lepeophtheirus salmonis]|uniref:ER membrane protein complex subunit 10 n=1 Tax=Lepeophtheirus salmonis TaxID=72036 RepID=A0A0K2V4I4_LEPSM|nr:ER membrane protein complex subunit 10-like [Lepeophtheirus salmonis]
MKLILGLLIYYSLYLSYAGGENADTSDLVLELEHSLDDGKTFSHRQTLRISASNLKSGTKSSMHYPVDESTQESIRHLCSSSGLYRFRIGIGEETRYSVSDPCFLIQNNFKEAISVILDPKNNVIGVSVYPYISFDHPGPGTVLLIPENTQYGPTPDTAAYIQKLEQEKLAKKRGDTKENASFISKYWMYIVPILIVVMMSSANANEGNGGGR